MKEHFFKRILDSFVTWIFVLILNFLLFYTQSLNRFSPAQIIKYLDFVFIKRFGHDTQLKMATLDYIFRNSAYSLILFALSLVTAIALGIFLGTLASYKQGGKTDMIITIAGLVSFTFPVWWVALVFRIYLYPTFPALYWCSEEFRVWKSPWSDIFRFIPDFLSHLVVPLLTFVLALTGIYLLVTRNSLRNIYTEDYMVTAKAKGLTPLKIMFKHALKNAIIPVLSVIALTPSLLVLGIIMIENVFQRTGMGWILMKSAIDPVTQELVSPTPLLQAVFIVFATIIIILHFFADVSLGVLDPRIRTDGAGFEKLDEKTESSRPSQPFRRKVWKFLKKFMSGYSGKFGLGIILFFAIGALIVPYLPFTSPFYPDFITPRSQPPNLSHFLGTDASGHDMLALLFWGARASLIEGLGAVALALTIGCFVGLFSGYYGERWMGYLLDRITDLFLAVPIIVVVVYFPMRASPLKSILAMGLTMWAVTAKLVRAEVISAKDKPFIEASRAAGAGNVYILFRRLLPECVPTIASSMLFVAVNTLAVQSCLDYLGFQRRLWSRIDPVTLPPYYNWGIILAYGVRDYVAFKQWWLIFPPGICIALFGLALVAIGNKIIEVTNPKLATYLAHPRGS